jgi:muramoyltetrapeptide carboxypeptidase
MERRDFSKYIGKGAIMSAISPFFSTTSVMQKPLIKPKALKKGDTIGLITPAGPVSADRIEKATKNMEAMGFFVKHSNAIEARYGHLAGMDQERLADIHRQFSDPQVNAVWAIRGGYGCTRLLPYIDYALIRKNPKVLLGYSDVTALHNAIHQKTGLVTFHGPVGATTMTDYNLMHLEAVVRNGLSPHRIHASEENIAKKDPVFSIEVFREGVATGILAGGNLCLLASMVGTPFQVDLRGKLVFIEDVGEKPYRIDRMLTQLLQSSNLHLAKGIILGIFEDCQPKDEQYSLSLRDTLIERLAGLGIPVIYGISFGHISNMCTLPIGIQARLDTAKQTVTLLEKAVS